MNRNETVFSAMPGNDRHVEIDGFPVDLKNGTHALIISSQFPSVLSQAYDYVRASSGAKLLHCQSLYGRGGGHALLFQFASQPSQELLSVLDGAPARWSLLRAAAN